MQLLIIFYIALLGLVMGCFLNVCIYRIPEKQSIINPPSHCTSCGTRLKPLDLVPVFSYLFLRGRCRYCGKKVSARYPIVEGLTAAVFVLLYYRLSLSVEFIAAAFLSVLLIGIFFIDLDYKVIPNGFILTGLAGGTALFICNIFREVSFYGDRAWYNPVLGMVTGAGALILVSFVGLLIYRTDEAMGMGDIKLLAVVGLFLGWRLTIAGIFLAIIFAAVFSLALILMKKHNRKSRIAFGPFIAMGTILAMTYGWNIIDFYFGLIVK